MIFLEKVIPIFFNKIMFENIRTITAVKLKEKYLTNGRKKRELI